MSELELRRYDQRVFDDGKGDCLAACIATLTQVPLEEIPNFAECGYFDGLRTWLDEHEMRGIQIRFADSESIHKAWFDYPKQLVLLWGDSPRFRQDGTRKQHAVVGRTEGYGVEIFHDPHPSRAGLHSIYGMMWIVCR